MRAVSGAPSIAGNELALVLHELRGPLGLIATAASSAADESGDEYLRSQCAVIERTAHRMISVASTVLSLFAEGRAADRTAFDPVPAVVSMISDLQTLGVPVTLEPLLEQPAPIRGSREDFEALLASLVMNARDHSNPGMPIHVQVIVRDGALEVSVLNSVGSSGTHAGHGMGTLIAEGLARRLGATLHRMFAGDTCRATIRTALA